MNDPDGVPAIETVQVADHQIELAPDDNGTIMVRVVGMPGATFGATRAEALVRARELIETLIDARGSPSTASGS